MKNTDQQIQDLISQKNFQKSAVLIRDRLKGDPESADAHYLLGVWHYFQGQVGPTIQALKKSLDLDPRHTDAAICLSVLLNDLGKYEDAKKIFDQANQSVAHRRAGTVSEVDQKFSLKHLEVGDLYFRYRRYEEAIEEYTKAALLNPLHLDIRIRRAKAYARKGFVSRALQDLQALKHERPDFIAGQIQLGLLYYSQGNLVDAEIEWEGVLDKNPGNKEAQAYLNMAKNSRDRRESPRLTL